jgi:(R,R)-butanediol dehydrogenase / meso-butanediol dehydrogenase / diacetyl reductase
VLAARLHGNHDLRVEDVPEPPGPGPDEVLVRTHWCGICGTDLHEYAHGPLYVPDANLPQILGHEFSAEVLAVGEGVTGVRVGERCAVLPHVFCGTCWFCVHGRHALCQSLRLTGVSWPWGGLAEQALVPAYQCVPLPDAVSLEQGAVVEPLSCAVHATERVVRAGDRVLVTGAGPIGQLVVLACKAAGAAHVWVSEPNPGRRAQAERLGADALDPGTTDVGAELRERTGGLGVDCSIECSGSQAGLDACVDATRAAGSVAQLGIHVGPRTVIPEAWVWKDLTITGIWSFNLYDTPRVLAQMAAGRLPVEQVVTSRIPVTGVVADGVQRLADPAGGEVKILVAPTAGPNPGGSG